MSQVPIVDQKNDDTLFKVMCDLKKGLNCQFEFSFNDENMEIFLACFLPNRNLLACFVIGNVKSGDVKAFPVYVDETYHAEHYNHLLVLVRRSILPESDGTLREANDLALE